MSRLLNATKIGEHFNVSSRQLNLILSELGFQRKEIDGWILTKLGESLGGEEYEHDISGNIYILWPENILKNRILLDSCRVPEETIQNKPPPFSDPIQKEREFQNNSLKDKFPPQYKTKDGHFVRSRGEVMIDNILYDYKLVHAYERQLPVEENVYSDFFIPAQSVYIEYWGLENDAKYIENKKRKISIYKKYDFRLIELTNDDISNLDDCLPKKLLKFGIKVY